MTDRSPITRRGYRMLEERLNQLKGKERLAVARDIERARAHGDISENAEFAAAKERQAHIEGQIRQLEDRLARAHVIDPAGQPAGAVRFGATVVLRDADSGEKVTYTIVGEDESDATGGLISVTSPVARALLGKGVEEVTKVRVPRGTRELEILEIRFD